MFDCEIRLPILTAEILINLLMTVPTGFLVALIERKHPMIAAVMSGLMLSVAVEVLQLVLRRGFFEFDDMVHNTVDAAIGDAIAINTRIPYEKSVSCKNSKN